MRKFNLLRLGGEARYATARRMLRNYGRVGRLSIVPITRYYNPLKAGGRQLKVFQPHAGAKRLVIHPNGVEFKPVVTPRSFYKMSAKLRALADFSAPGKSRGTQLYRFYSGVRKAGAGKFGGVGAFKGRGRGWRRFLPGAR